MKNKILILILIIAIAIIWLSAPEQSEAPVASNPAEGMVTSEQTPDAATPPEAAPADAATAPTAEVDGVPAGTEVTGDTPAATPSVPAPTENTTQQ